MYDWLIVGAGFAGSVLAKRLASQRGENVLVIDRRPHVEPAAPQLAVEVPSGADFCWADAFLDLLLDGERGALSLDALGPGNHYQIAQRGVVTWGVTDVAMHISQRLRAAP